MNYKHVPFEYKLSKDDRVFEGYASTFGNRDLVGDVVMKGSFLKSIEEKFPKNQIKVLWQHDPAEVIGKPLHLEEDEKGLFARFEISQTSRGRDTITLLKDQIIDTLSIGYEVEKDSLSQDGKTRYLESLILHEFSVVTFPANPEALITNPFKSFQHVEDIKGFFMSEIKEGRVLSKGNRAKIETCIKALQEILDIDGKEKEKNLDLFTDLLEDMKAYTKKLQGGNS